MFRPEPGDSEGATKIGDTGPATADTTAGGIDPVWWILAIVGGALVVDNLRFHQVKR